MISASEKKRGRGRENFVFKGDVIYNHRCTGTGIVVLIELNENMS